MENTKIKSFNTSEFKVFLLFNACINSEIIHISYELK